MVGDVLLLCGMPRTWSQVLVAGAAARAQQVTEAPRVSQCVRAAGAVSVAACTGKRCNIFVVPNLGTV